MKYQYDTFNVVYPIPPDYENNQLKSKIVTIKCKIAFFLFLVVIRCSCHDQFNKLEFKQMGLVKVDINCVLLTN